MNQLFKDKKIVRKQLVTTRNNIAADQRQAKSKAIAHIFFDHLLSPSVHSVFSYVHYQSEVETYNLLQRIIDNKKKVSVPLVCSSNSMSAVEIKDLQKELSPGFKGIFEPNESLKKTREVDPETIDMVIVPGVAFDIKGGRLGYGGGYYDRFLSKKELKAIKVGFSFELLVFDEIITESHDVLMDYVVTEENIIKI